MKLLLKLFYSCILVFIDIASCFDYCEIRFPKQNVPDTDKFDIFTDNGKVSFTNMSTYIPGKTYDIKVFLNTKARLNNLNIREIYVLAQEIQSTSEESEENSWIHGGELYFNVTQASKTEYCPQRAHIHYLYTQPEHVTFYWLAPKVSEFCIRITVILNMDDNSIENFLEEQSHTLCDQTKKKHGQMQGDQAELLACVLKKEPEKTKKCNIPSTAVYRMTIENKWNSLNHWKDWPGKDGYTPKLTQYLGASHSSNFNIYHLGGMASHGVLQVCANGTYNLLKQQFYKAGNGIMTVILARSLDASSKTNKRSALIVVNSTLHLVSFLSRLEPSPDWCTGLSRFDLCTGKCSWPSKVSVSIYPWDAGIYTGETYLQKKEIQAQTTICPITSNWPKDNPFTVINGKMQPIGTVTFQLIQEYNKQENQNCNTDNSVLQDEAYTNEPVGKLPQYSFQKSNPEKMRHCSMTPWSDWTPCSKLCGKGERVRYRSLVKGNPEKCIMVSVKDVENCHQKCTVSSSMETCSLRLWSPWSPCNATCSQRGIIYRERVFINEQEKNECMVYSGMKEINTCRLVADRCNSQIVCREYVNYGDLCSWSYPLKRYYYDFSTGNCNSFLYKGCYGGLNNFHTYEECNSLCGNSYIKNIPQQLSKSSTTFGNRCDDPMTWGVTCDSEYPSTRWSFDKINKKCFKFHFNGCRGNANNFKEKLECENVCLKTGSHEINQVTQTTSMKPRCLYSQWSEWSSCDEDCKKQQTRFRMLIEKQGDCNEALSDIRKCQSETCKIPKPDVKTIKKCKYSNWSTWSTCSSQCGRGVRERKRKKLSTKCKPEFPQFTERESCYNACAFN